MVPRSAVDQAGPSGSDLGRTGHRSARGSRSSDAWTDGAGTAAPCGSGGDGAVVSGGSGVKARRLGALCATALAMELLPRRQMAGSSKLSDVCYSEERLMPLNSFLHH